MVKAGYLASRIRPIAARAIRALPPFRGRGRIASALNSVFLALGADPIVITKMTAGHQLRLDVRLFSHCHAYYSGQYDDAKRVMLLRFLTPGGAALDVGGNIGFYAVPMALVAKRAAGHLVIVEPVPTNLTWLHDNLTLNAVGDAATVLPLGLSDQPSETEIVLAGEFLTGACIGNAIIANWAVGPQFRRVTIRLDTLDRVWPSINRQLDIIKLDIEGYEGKFLKGAHETIKQHRPVILMEVNRWFYQKRDEDFDKLIPELLPSDYILSVLYKARSLQKIERLSSVQDTDVFFVPRERRGHLVSG